MVELDDRLEEPIPIYARKVFLDMFSDHRNVIIKSEFTSGLSGSHVYLVRPIRRNGRPELPCVVKIDIVARIKQEWDAYKACIEHCLPNVAEIKDEPRFPPGSRWGGLRYPLAGEGAFNVKSLHEYYKGNDATGVAHILKNRLFKSLDKLWQQKSVQAELYLHTHYDSFLPENLTLAHAPNNGEWLHPKEIHWRSLRIQKDDFVQLSGFRVVKVWRDKPALLLDYPKDQSGAYRVFIKSVPAIEAYEVDQVIHKPLGGQVINTRLALLQAKAQKAIGAEFDLTAASLPLTNQQLLPNPLATLSTILNTSFDAHVACIHGDLNLQNVLIEPQGHNAYLIDFVNARQDHVLRDLVHLEMAIATQCLPFAFDQNANIPQQINAFFETLHCLHTQEIEVPIALRKPIQVVHTIRQAAEKYLFEQHEWGEYYYSLIIYLLGALRYDSLDTVPHAKQVAFWGAATLLKLIEEGVECDQLATAVSPSAIKETNKVNQKASKSTSNNSSTVTNFHGQVSGSIHTGSGDINIQDNPNKKQQYLLVRLRLDVALPETVYVNHYFDIALSIRYPNSPILKIDELDRVESKFILASKEDDASNIPLRVEINAPECEIQGNSYYNFRLSKYADTPVFFFKVKPLKVGRLCIVFTVFQENYWIGSALSCTNTVGKQIGNSAIDIKTLPIDGRSFLRRVLDRYFNESDLRNLTFDLGIEYENLLGQTKGDKARELVAYCERHGRIYELELACRKLRPNANWDSNDYAPSKPNNNKESNIDYADPYAGYERGLVHLKADFRRRMDTNDPRYSEVLTYEQRLRENISRARLYGDTSSSSTGRAEIIDRLNALAMASLGISFNDMCE